MRAIVRYSSSSRADRPACFPINVPPLSWFGAYFACAAVRVLRRARSRSREARLPPQSVSEMQLDVPDPRYTHSAHSRALFALAVRLSIGLVVVLWLIHLMNWGMDLDPLPFGVRPREWLGLVGIVTAPLVHGDFAHLVANSAPLLLLGAVTLFLYPHSTLRVLPAIYLGPGVAVWLFGRDSVHIGASGLVYGLVSYVFVAGLLRRDRRAVAASLLVALMYGTLAWGVLPIQPRMSWETHLAATVIGVLLALALRKLDIPPRKRYAWEDEAEPPEEEPEWWSEAEEGGRRQ